MLVNFSISIFKSLITFVKIKIFFWIKKFLIWKKMAHHFLKNYFFKKFFLLIDLDLLFSAKKFLRFFFWKYLQKLVTLSLHTIKSFQIGKKLTENFQYPNFYIFVRLNLFRSLFTIFYIYIVIFDWHANYLSYLNIGYP